MKVLTFAKDENMQFYLTTAILSDASAIWDPYFNILYTLLKYILMCCID